MAGVNAKSQEPLLAFVHIQKTAGSTLKLVLQNTFCVQLCNLIPQVDPAANEEDLSVWSEVHLRPQFDRNE